MNRVNVDETKSKKAFHIGSLWKREDTKDVYILTDSANGLYQAAMLGTGHLWTVDTTMEKAVEGLARLEAGSVVTLTVVE